MCKAYKSRRQMSTQQTRSTLQTFLSLVNNVNVIDITGLGNYSSPHDANPDAPAMSHG